MPQHDKETLELELPNGQVAEIQVPKGASPAQVQLSIKAFRSKNPQLFEVPREQAPSQVRRMSLFEAGKIGPIPGGEPVALPEIQPPQEMLPALGGGIGAAAGAPAGGVPAVAGAALGGAAGESARQLINRFSGFGGAPQTSEQAFEDISKEGAIQGAIEGVFRGGGSIVRALRNLMGNRLTVKQGIEILSENLFKEKLSPKQFGDELKSLFDTSKSNASDALKSVTEKIAKENPNLRVQFNSSLELVDREISKLRARIARKPQSGTIDPTTGKDTRESAVAALEDLKKLFESENSISRASGKPARVSEGARGERPEVPAAPTNINLALSERSEAFKLSKVLKGEAEGFESNLTKAIHQDISDTLKAANKGADVLAFEKASGRVRELLNLTEKEQAKELANVFGDKRATSEKVSAILANVPEESIAAVQLLRETRGDKALQPVRQAIFESMAESGKLPRTNSKVIREVFGTQAEKVEKFGQILAKAERGEGLRGLITFITSRVGPNRFGLNVPGSGTVLEIRAKDLVKLLDDPKALDTIISGFSKPPTGAGAAQMLRLLEGLFNERRQGIATVGEQLSPEERRALLEQRRRLARGKIGL